MVLFVQFEKREKHPWRILTFKQSSMGVFHVFKLYKWYQITNAPFSGVFGGYVLQIFIWNHSLSTYAKFSEKLTRTYACQWVRNVSFLENLAYVLNEWSLFIYKFNKTIKTVIANEYWKRLKHSYDIMINIFVFRKGQSSQKRELPWLLFT